MRTGLDEAQVLNRLLVLAGEEGLEGAPSALSTWLRQGEVGRDRKSLWPGFLLPGVIVGFFGYAIGTYLGFSVAYLLQGTRMGL
jgi:hypothetical protein